MTTFEYLAIAYSLIFSATALRLVGGLPHAFRTGRRYSVHAAFVILVLFGTVQNFWAFLGYQVVEWTFARFIGMLAIPGMLYFVASMLIPDDPSLIECWKNHYFQRRAQLFSGITGWGVLTLLNTTFILGMPLAHPARVVQLGLLSVGVCGLSSARPMVHKILIGVMLILALAFPFIVMRLGITGAG